MDALLFLAASGLREDIGAIASPQGERSLAHQLLSGNSYFSGTIMAAGKWWN